MSDPAPPNDPNTDDQASTADPAAQGDDKSDDSSAFTDGDHHNADGPND